MILYIIIVVILCQVSFLLGAISMRQHLTGEWLPEGWWKEDDD